MICACEIQYLITWVLNYAEPLLSVIDVILNIWFGSEQLQFTPVVEQHLNALAQHITEIFGSNPSACEMGAAPRALAHA